MRVAPVRTWLKQNEVFFNTAAAVLLSVMALVVAFAQHDLAERQTEIADAQLALSRRALMPEFVISAHQLKPHGSETSTEDVIRVENRGAPVHSLTSRTVTYVDVEYSSGLPRSPFRRVAVPVVGYYSVTGHGDKASGVMLQMEGQGNNKWMSDLRRAFSERTRKVGGFGNLGIRRYVRLAYVDKLGESNVQYFFVPLIYGARPLDPKDGQSIFSEHEQSLADGSSMDTADLTAQALLDLVTD